MSDIHVTRELLRAVARGELAERAFAQIQAEHLANLCPVCREEIRAWAVEQSTEQPPNAPNALEALPFVLGRHAPDLEARRGLAEQDFEALLALPPAERRGRIDRARGRFRGTVLAERLLEESRRRTPSDPEEGYHLADLARAVLHRSPGHPDAFGLVALASARMANARRAEGDLGQAHELFRFVRHLVSHEAVTDPWVLGEIDHLEGSLRKDQRRFEDAEALLSRSAMLFRIVGAAVETARTLLNLGELYFHQGRPEPAIRMVRAALEGLPAAEEPRLFLMGGTIWPSIWRRRAGTRRRPGWWPPTRTSMAGSRTRGRSSVWRGCGARSPPGRGTPRRPSASFWRPATGSRGRGTATTRPWPRSTSRSSI